MKTKLLVCSAPSVLSILTLILLSPPILSTNNTCNYFQNSLDELLTKHLEISLCCSWCVLRACVRAFVLGIEVQRADLKPIFHSIYLKIVLKPNIRSAFTIELQRDPGLSVTLPMNERNRMILIRVHFFSISLKFNSRFFVLVEQLSNLLNPKWQMRFTHKHTNNNNEKNATLFFFFHWCFNVNKSL